MNNLSQVLASLSPEQQRLFQQKLNQLHQQKMLTPGERHIGRRSQANDLPLSYAQQRLYFLDQLEPQNPDYHLPAYIRMVGQLHVAALQASLTLLAHRHEILRTSFPTQGGQPVQHIDTPAPVELPVTDLRGLAVEQQEQMVQQLIEQETRRPFDLAHGPTWRVRLLWLGEQEHLLLVNLHHIVTDGWSSSVLVRELSQAYTALSAGQEPMLPPLPVQYGDFACWQQQWLGSRGAEAQLVYWRERLSGSGAHLTLPWDHTRPVVQTFRGAEYSRALPVGLGEALGQLSRQEGASLFMTMLAGFAMLLLGYTSQEDVSIGTFHANRNRHEIEGLIGYFLNTLVLRADLSGQPTVREVIGRMRQVCLEAYEHQDVPFEKVLEAVQPERDRGHAPLFQVMAVMMNLPDRTLHLPALDLQVLPGGPNYANVDLTLWLHESSQGLTASLEYNVDLFEQRTIERMLTHYETVLRAMVAHPEQPITAVSVLSPQEYALLVHQWNATQTSFPRPALVHELIAAQAARTPHATAVVWGTNSLSYQELEARANHLATYLHTCGVGPEVPVGLYLERSLEAVVAQLAILKAGGVCLPLDEYAPLERLVTMLQGAQATLVLTQQSLGYELAIASAGSLSLLYLDRELPEQPMSPTPLPSIQPENLALIIYTSGSTGTPKGAMISHANLCNYASFFAQQYQLPTRITAHLQMASLAFDVFMADMLRALTTGARLVLCPRETLLDAPALYALMRQEGVDSAEFVPAVLKTLVEYVLASGQSLDFMHVLAAGADSWPVADYEQVRQVVGAQTRLLNVYGLTEATIDNAHWAGDEVPVTLTGVMPIGRPIANTQLYIVDRWLQPVPLGVQGELVIGGQGVGRGYSGQAGLTAERFLPDPFSDMPGARLYRSGDAVRYRPDGTIEFLGRIDQQIKIRGFRIEPGEIEAQLQKHVRVQSAVVLPRREGLSSVHLVAYIVLYPSSGDEPFDAVTLVENIRTFLRARLPDYMIPTSFVFLDALPLTPNKKIDRNALEGTDSRPIEVKRAYEPPRTETEQAVAAIWTKLTGVEQVGLHDNFFELGGHSLLLSRLVAQIRDTFQIHLPMRDVFIDATVANVVAVIERAQSKARQFAATDEERLTQLVDGLSEEQVDAMLDGLLPQKLQW